jgi:hypothetical protein
MKAIDYLGGSGERDLRPHNERVGYVIIGALLTWLVVTQTVAIHSTQNGLSSLDPYDEADGIRAAEYYARYGFLKDAGLPHIGYGDRFPSAGWVGDANRTPLPSGVYTHWPPLPHLICGVLEKVIGFRYLWAWRLLPVSLGVGSVIYSFFTFKGVLGPTLSALMTAFLFAVPAATVYMDGLDSPGFATSLFLVQLCLLVRIIFAGGSRSFGNYAAIFVLAFLQGSLCLERVFVVTGAAIPIALVAQSDRHELDRRTMLFLVIASGAGFFIAHVLHFLQVAGFYGSIGIAWRDLSGRAAYRMIGNGQESYPKLVFKVLHRYSAELWFSPRGFFGFLLPFLSATLLFDRISALSSRGWRRSRGRNYIDLAWDLKVIFPVVLSYSLAAVWLLVMPSMSIYHTHFVPCIFFLPYFVLVLIAGLRASELLKNVEHSGFLR